MSRGPFNGRPQQQTGLCATGHGRERLGSRAQLIRHLFTLNGSLKAQASLQTEGVNRSTAKQQHRRRRQGQGKNKPCGAQLPRC